MLQQASKLSFLLRGPQHLKYSISVSAPNQMRWKPNLRSAPLQKSEFPLCFSLSFPREKPWGGLFLLIVQSCAGCHLQYAINSLMLQQSHELFCSQKPPGESKVCWFPISTLYQSRQKSVPQAIPPKAGILDLSSTLLFPSQGRSSKLDFFCWSHQAVLAWGRSDCRLNNLKNLQ